MCDGTDVILCVMALKLKATRRSTPKVISREYLAPTGKSEVGVSAIRRAVKATKESKAKVTRAL